MNNTVRIVTFGDRWYIHEAILRPDIAPEDRDDVTYDSTTSEWVVIRPAVLPDLGALIEGMNRLLSELGADIPQLATDEDGAFGPMVVQTQPI